MGKSTSKVYFKGLNALRFFAALLVVLMHMKSNLTTSGLPTFSEVGIFSKGLIAVSFFFVLSGFLITYLLYIEHEKNKRISVKAFYLRRVFRIWPLYFLIVAIGLFFYWLVAPKMGLDMEIEYNKPLAVFLYTFFGANILNSLYHVGGILHVTWSISVEEQFYLIWAPVFQKFKKHIKQILYGTLIVSAVIATLNKINFFGLSSGWQIFLDTLQFHYMCIGGILAYELYHNKEKFMNHIVFRSKRIQIVLLTLLLSYLFFYLKTDWAEPLLILPQGLLFGWLIVNVSSNEKSILNLEIKPFNYLGKISYGIYMYHMLAVYFLSFAASKLFSPESFGALHMTIYAISVIALTVVISAISYELFEKKLMKKGGKVSKNIINKELEKKTNSSFIETKVALN